MSAYLPVSDREVALVLQAARSVHQSCYPKDKRGRRKYPERLAVARALLARDVECLSVHEASIVASFLEQVEDVPGYLSRYDRPVSHELIRRIYWHFGDTLVACAL